MPKTTVKISSDFEPFKCDVCGDEFEESWKLEKHMTIEHQAENYSCDHCAKSFYMEWRFKRHIAVHDNSDRRKCHFFNNEKSCPYEEVGCKFKHEYAGNCVLGLKCFRKNCQFQHSNDLFDKLETKGHDNVIQTNCSMCEMKFGVGATVKTIQCEECYKFVCRGCALKSHVTEDTFICKMCV